MIGYCRCPFKNKTWYSKLLAIDRGAEDQQLAWPLKTMRAIDGCDAVRKRCGLAPAANGPMATRRGHVHDRMHLRHKIGSRLRPHIQADQFTSDHLCAPIFRSRGCKALGARDTLASAAISANKTATSSF
jgi:hypothetical protein